MLQEELKYLRAAIHLGLLSREECQGPLSENSQGSPEERDKALWNRLVQEKNFSSQEREKVESLVRDGYLFCSPCQTISPFPQEGHSLSYPCPQCQNPLEVFLPSFSGEEDLFKISPSKADPAPALPFMEDQSSGKDWESFAFQKTPPLKSIKLLGKGGYGEVYSVRDPMSNRSLALKIISARKLNNIPIKKRFLREIQITSLLEHPNIIPLYESGSLDDGSLYFTMEEIRGETLWDLLKKKKIRGMDGKGLMELLEIFLKVCQGMEYAHAGGVIHRDLKPSNIAVGTHGEVIIMDWGIAKKVGVEEVEGEESEDLEMAEGLTLKGSILGTPGYLSPEQAQGQEVDEKTDVYSLGAILYQMIALSTPFQGSTKEKLVATLMRDPLPPEQVNPDFPIPPELSAIAMKALARDKKRRYKGVRKLREDIQLFLQGHSVSAKRDLFWEKCRKWVSRHKGVFSGILLCAFVVFPFFSAHLWWKKTRFEKGTKDLWVMANQILESKEALGEEKLREKFEWKGSLSGVTDPGFEQAKEKSFELHLRARTVLEEILRWSPQNIKARKKLFLVERELGLLALSEGNYLLSRLCFERCSRLGYTKKGRALLGLIEKDKEAREKAWESQVQGWMKDLETEAFLLEKLVEYSSQMAGPGRAGRAELLMAYLDSPHKGQRILAIEGLGKLGDKNFQWKKITLKKSLMDRLKKVLPLQAPLEAESLIWALGRLGVKEALPLIDQVRKSAGEKSVLWKNTAKPRKLLRGPV